MFWACLHSSLKNGNKNVTDRRFHEIFSTYRWRVKCKRVGTKYPNFFGAGKKAKDRSEAREVESCRGLQSDGRAPEKCISLFMTVINGNVPVFSAQVRLYITLRLESCRISCRSKSGRLSCHRDSCKVWILWKVLYKLLNNTKRHSAWIFFDFHINGTQFQKLSLLSGFLFDVFKFLKNRI